MKQIKSKKALNKAALSLIVMSLISTAYSDTTSNPIYESMVNLPPVACQEMTNQMAQQDTPFKFVLSDKVFFDPENKPLTYSVLLADGSVLPSWLSYNQTTKTLSGNPSKDNIGVLPLKIVAEDSGGLTAEQTFQLTVKAFHQAPFVNRTLSEQNIEQGVFWQYQIPADAFISPDNDKLTYSFTASINSMLPAWLTFDPETRTFSGIPKGENQADIELLVKATDPSGLAVIQKLTLHIEQATDGTPIASTTMPYHSIKYGSMWSYTFPKGAFIDFNNDTLSYDITLIDGSALPEWLTFNEANKTLFGIPLPQDIGKTLQFKVTVTNTKEQSASQVFGLTIQGDGDQVPYMSYVIPNFKVNKNNAWSFSLASYHFKTPNSQLASSTVTLADGGELPSWLTLTNKNGYFTLSGKPTENEKGELKLRITVTDAKGNSTSTIHFLTVTDFNNPPTKTSMVTSPVLLTERKAFSFVLPELFSDYDNDPLSLSITLPNGSPLPNWLKFNQKTNTLYGVAPERGFIKLSIVATDLSGDSDQDFLTLYVKSDPLLHPDENIIFWDDNSVATNQDDYVENLMRGYVEALDGNNTIISYEGSINTGNGNNHIITYGGHVQAGDGNNYIQDLGLGSAIYGGAANDRITVNNAYYVNGGDGDDYITSGDEYSYITGGAGNDILHSINASHDNTYDVILGEGHNTIYDAGGEDHLTFDYSITKEQLWFSRVDNDLVINVIGTTDGVTIKNWYINNKQHQIENIMAEGYPLNLSKLDNLVQAMAELELPPLGQTTLTADYLEVLQPVIEDSWN